MIKKKVLIFGCGFHGRAAFRKCFKLKKKFNVIGWIDNDKKKEKKLLFKKKIYLPDKIKKLEFDKIIICGRDIASKTKQINRIVDNKKLLYWGNNKIKPSKTNILKRDNSLIKILKNVIEKFEKEKILYWVDSSALLTLSRKENLSIRSDFDIAVDKVHINLIKKLFKSNKFYNFNKIQINKSKIKLFFTSKNKIFEYEPAIVDLCFKDFSKKKYIFNYGNSKKKFLKSFFKRFRYIKYNKIKFKVPFETKKYLKYLYGDWKVKKNFYENPLAKKNAYLHQPFIFKAFKV